jgi:RadC-like JAB domain
MRYNTGYAACGITGDPSPSEADLRLTRRISEAARILQIQLLDHVIILSKSLDKMIYAECRIMPSWRQRGVRF